jgi:hypothetical protein
MCQTLILIRSVAGLCKTMNPMNDRSHSGRIELLVHLLLMRFIEGLYRTPVAIQEGRYSARAIIPYTMTDLERLIQNG